MPIPETGCWIWTGSWAGGGYGILNAQKKRQYAHRFAYEHFKGNIPPKANVLHKCDTPSCVNPDHLFLGTIADNNNDASLKGRKAKKILNHEVYNVKDLHDYGFSMPQIANMYDVRLNTIWQVLRERIPFLEENKEARHPMTLEETE
jgi:hypothetical protein